VRPSGASTIAPFGAGHRSGSGADPWITGTMGGGILESFDVIFDYPHERIGFVEHDSAR